MRWIDDLRELKIIAQHTSTSLSGDKTYVQMHLDIISFRIEDENYNLKIIFHYE